VLHLWNAERVQSKVKIEMSAKKADTPAELGTEGFSR
jgi:hypothetical protein